MAKFKKGDRVIVTDVSKSSVSRYRNGITGTILDESSTPSMKWDDAEMNMTNYGIPAITEDALSLIGKKVKLTADKAYGEWIGGIDWCNGIKINKQTIMNKVSNFAKKLISPELVTLIDAGLIDSCTLALTSIGKDKLLETLFEANKAALVEVAKEIIAESEKK